MSARRSDLEPLHPLMRAAVSRVQEAIAQEKLAFRLYESFRSPDRQRSLYAQGRDIPGDIVTKARPWGSYHQYGLAVDFVLFLDGRWAWRTDGPHERAWQRLHAIGRAHGLEPLSWERPHLQYADTSIARLRRGDYPPGGDDDWTETMREAIAGWTGPEAPPPPPADMTGRPPLRDPAPEEDEEIFPLFTPPDPGPLREQPERGLTAPIIQAARASQLLWGVPCCVTLAQYVLESAGGKRMPPGSNNPFGIKARAGEAFVTAPTTEVVNGRPTRIFARFRKFASLDDAFSHHGRLLATAPHYARAMSLRADPAAFAHALTGVYATDPRYGAKLVDLIERCDLRLYDPVPAEGPSAAAVPAAAAALPAPKLGDRGENVRALQQSLVSAGYSLGAVDGIFGTLTRTALLGFQADNGLPLTGLADAATVARLNAAPPRPLDRERMTATEQDLQAKGSVTMTEARRTRLLGLVTSVLGAFGIGNSAILAGAATPAAAPPAAEAVLARVATVLADPQARNDPATVEALLRSTGEILSGAQVAASPELGRLAGELLRVLPPDIAARSPELAQVLTLLSGSGAGAGVPRTVFDLLPGMFADGSALQTTVQGVAALASSMIPGLGGSVAALGIGLLARHFGNRIATARLREHQAGSNLNR